MELAGSGSLLTRTPSSLFFDGMGVTASCGHSYFPSFTVGCKRLRRGFLRSLEPSLSGNGLVSRLRLWLIVCSATSGSGPDHPVEMTKSQ